MTVRNLDVFSYGLTQLKCRQSVAGWAKRQQKPDSCNVMVLLFYRNLQPVLKMPMFFSECPCTHVCSTWTLKGSIHGVLKGPNVCSGLDEEQQAQEIGHFVGRPLGSLALHTAQSRLHFYTLRPPEVGLTHTLGAQRGWSLKGFSWEPEGVFHLAAHFKLHVRIPRPS